MQKTFAVTPYATAITVDLAASPEIQSVVISGPLDVFLSGLTAGAATSLTITGNGGGVRPIKWPAGVVFDQHQGRTPPNYVSGNRSLRIDFYALGPNAADVHALIFSS